MGLVVNAVVLWNSRYLSVAVEQLRRDGVSIVAEDLVRLSPLGHEHINVEGRYSFALAEPIAQGQLRPLGNSTNVEEFS